MKRYCAHCAFAYPCTAPFGQLGLRCNLTRAVVEPRDGCEHWTSKTPRPAPWWRRWLRKEAKQ